MIHSDIMDGSSLSASLSLCHLTSSLGICCSHASELGSVALQSHLGGSLYVSNDVIRLFAVLQRYAHGDATVPQLMQGTLRCVG